jgi:hypothetical protein
MADKRLADPTFEVVTDGSPQAEREVYAERIKAAAEEQEDMTEIIAKWRQDPANDESGWFCASDEE